MKKKIIFAAAECAPFVKVGGLADVVGSLPKALNKIGGDVQVILPYYGSTSVNKKDVKLWKKNIPIFFDGKKESFNLWKTNLPGSKVPLFLVKNNRYFKGDVYTNKNNTAKEQVFEAKRFLFFMKSIVEFSKITKADIVHCHDWHTSLVPLLLKDSKKTRSIFTIHNIAYQGIFNESLINSVIGADFKEQVNCMKVGIENADTVTTVSSNYAKEILSPKFGFGLESALRKRKKNLVGIVNGIDSNQFSPETDGYIKTKYSLRTIQKKKENKRHLQEICFGEFSEDKAVIGIVSRIAEQKGFDLIEDVFSKIIKKNLQIIILGEGMKKYENFFLKQSKVNPKKVFIKVGFDEKFAHEIYAGSDMFLMPSFFEPCGLGQMIAMKYGTVPIVRAVGGLKDTVLPFNKSNGTGFLFKNHDSKEMLKEIEKAVLFFQKKEKWMKLQKNGMKQDFSWKNSAKKYLKLYKKTNSR